MTAPEIPERRLAPLPTEGMAFGMEWGEFLARVRQELNLDASTDLLSGTIEATLQNDLVWQSLPYNATNWTGYGTAGFQDAQYGLDALGFVNLRGWVKSVAGYAFGAGTARVATLPVGYRPGSNEPFLVEQKDSAGNIDVIRANVATNGDIVVVENATTATGVGNNGIVVYLAIPSGTRFQQVN